MIKVKRWWNACRNQWSIWQQIFLRLYGLKKKKKEKSECDATDKKTENPLSCLLNHNWEQFFGVQNMHSAVSTALPWNGVSCSMRRNLVFCKQSEKPHAYLSVAKTASENRPATLQLPSMNFLKQSISPSPSPQRYRSDQHVLHEIYRKADTAFRFTFAEHNCGLSQLHQWIHHDHS